MNINPFLQCLGATGINTGVSILGVYSFASGDTLMAYNQLYSSGFHYISGIPYNDALPLIFNGSGNQTSGVFNGKSFYQVSNTFTVDFSAIINLNYSGCLYSGSNNLILASTSLSSGVVIGITPSNRLFLQTPDYSYTIPKEIGVNDFVYFSVLKNRFLNFGLFSVEDNVFYNKGYDETNSKILVTDLYFGGALSYSSLSTGYSGKINEIYLFSGVLTSNNVVGCVNCAFATGFSYVTSPYSYNQSQITGSFWTGISTTGTIQTTKVLTSYPKSTGGSGLVYVDSGISGSISIGQALIPLTQNISQTGFTSGLTFYFNTTSQISLFDFYFPTPLVSGDIVEIYTYPTFNQNIDGLIYNFQYPRSLNTVQIYANGIAVTNGINYTVAFNNLIVGYDSLDILQYDIYPTTYTMPYTTGYIQTGTTGSAFVNITGISGIAITGFYYDFYMNGQKLATGVNFSISGSTMTVSGNELMDINDISGDYPELKFIPQYSGLITSLSQIVTPQSYISGISGFSEQVWLNGARQFEGLDFFKYPRCRTCMGNFVNPGYPFTLYNTMTDSVGLFSFQTAQSGITGQYSLFGLDGGGILGLDGGFISGLS